MLQMWEEEKQNPSWKREFDPDYWGSAFQHLPKLKTLTMEFETEKSCVAQVEAIAKHAAQAWKFPMGERGLLSAEGNDIKTWEWDGPPCMLSNSQRISDPLATPILVVKGVKWKLVAI